jgi:hypothetical protein
MKKLMLKMSRRERLYVIAGGAILLFGVVVYPAAKTAKAFRVEQVENLENEVALLEDLRSMLENEAAIELENEQLREALRDADELLFPPIENPIMTQTMMIKLLNELGPDLDLDISAGRSSVGDGANQMNLTVKGRGRYPELLNFLYRVETYRPLILVNEVNLMAPKPKRTKPAKKGSAGSKKAMTQKTKDPGMAFKLTIQINSRDREVGK